MPPKSLGIWPCQRLERTSESCQDTEPFQTLIFVAHLLEVCHETCVRQMQQQTSDLCGHILQRRIQTNAASPMRTRALF